MKTTKIVHWEEDGMWLGYLQDYPDYWTQGESLEELLDHLRDLEDERRWDDIETALGRIDDGGHEWDDDPAAWIRRQRQGDDRRSG